MTIEQAIAKLVQKTFATQAYAYLYRSPSRKTRYEVVITDNPKLYGSHTAGRHTCIRVEDKKTARRIAAQYNAKCWNF